MEETGGQDGSGWKRLVDKTVVVGRDWWTRQQWLEETGGQDGSGWKRLVDKTVVVGRDWWTRR